MREEVLIPTFDQMAGVFATSVDFNMRGSTQYPDNVRSQEEQYLTQFLWLADALRPARAMLAGFQGWSHPTWRATRVLIDAFDTYVREWGWERLAGLDAKAEIACCRQRYHETLVIPVQRIAMAIQAGFTGLDGDPCVDTEAEAGRQAGLTPYSSDGRDLWPLFHEAVDRRRRTPCYGSAWPRLMSLEQNHETFEKAVALLGGELEKVRPTGVRLPERLTWLRQTGSTSIPTNNLPARPASGTTEVRGSFFADRLPHQIVVPRVTATGSTARPEQDQAEDKNEPQPAAQAPQGDTLEDRFADELRLSNKRGQAALVVYMKDKVKASYNDVAINCCKDEGDAEDSAIKSLIVRVRKSINKSKTVKGRLWYSYGDSYVFKQLTIDDGENKD